MLSVSSPGYLGHFTPFPFDAASLRRMIAAASDDRHWGIFYGPTLAGFFMLRGFDSGYDVPAFGVAVAEPFARRGLLRLSLSFAIAWCRLNRVDRLMLKVHPDNVVAAREYEYAGFRFDRIDPASGQHVCYLDLPAR